MADFIESIVQYGTTHRFYIAVGVGSLLVGALILRAVKSYFGGGVCYSKAMLTGKTVIITGANTGIGLETAVDLAKRGARVILACRNVAKGKAAEAEVKERSKSDDVVFSKLDLSSLQSVREFSERTLEEESHIDILLNNGGVMIPPYSTTEDGFELQFGVNHLGHFLLTNLLLERMKKAPAGRIITVSSLAHIGGKINFDDLQSKQSYSRIGAYAQSKLANIIFTKSLAKMLRGTNTTAYCLHPGSVKTELSRHIPGPLVSSVLQGSLSAVTPRAYILLRRRGHATVQPSNFSVLLFLEHVLQAVLACARANWGYVAIFSNAEKFRCLYSHYGSCMPSSPKEYISPW